MDGILPLGRAPTQGAFCDVANGLFHLVRAVVGALLVVGFEEI
jgi:hypothetical protein